jgi:hypothetical protein
MSFVSKEEEKRNQQKMNKKVSFWFRYNVASNQFSWKNKQQKVDILYSCILFLFSMELFRKIL